MDECRKALIAEGAQYISCYVTHAVFPNEAYKKFLPNGPYSGINRFYVTNTNPCITDKLEDLGTLKDNPFYVINLGITLMKSLVGEKYIYGSKFNPAQFTLASNKNGVKCHALSDVLSNYFNRVNGINPFYENIYCHEVDSKINPQPVGIKEIESGVINRINGLGFFSGRNKVAIENGIIKCKINREINRYPNQQHNQQINQDEVKIEEDLYYDFACIVVEIDEKRYTRWSVGTYLPSCIFEESKATNFQTTGGHILSNKTKEELLVLVNQYEKLANLPLSTIEMIPDKVDPADWHLLFGPRTRKQILKETLISFFQDYILYYSNL